MNAAPQTSDAPPPLIRHERFKPESVGDLIGPVEAIVRMLVGQFQRQGLTNDEVRRHLIAAVDSALLAREPWSQVVPATVREDLVSRILRGHQMP